MNTPEFIADIIAAVKRLNNGPRPDMAIMSPYLFHHWKRPAKASRIRRRASYRKFKSRQRWFQENIVAKGEPISLE